MLDSHGLTVLELPLENVDFLARLASGPRRLEGGPPRGEVSQLDLLSRKVNKNAQKRLKMVEQLTLCQT